MRCLPCFDLLLFDLLRTEAHPDVRVVLGHFIFVYIPPLHGRQRRDSDDANGRVIERVA